MNDVTVKAPPRQCPYCKATVGQHETMAVCELCLSVHHHDCWSDHGGCSVFGCNTTNALVRSDGNVPVAVDQSGASQPHPPAEAVADDFERNSKYALIALMVVALLVLLLKILFT